MNGTRVISRLRDDRGAAAVEFALVLPVLISLLLGIMEFGNIYNAQITLTAAAREGARTMAIKNDPVAARNAVRGALTLNPAPTDAQISVTPTTCANGLTDTVTVTYPLPALTGFFGQSFTLQGKGVMRCGG